MRHGRVQVGVSENNLSELFLPQTDGLNDIPSSNEESFDEGHMMSISQLDGAVEKPMKDSFQGLAGLISDGAVIPFLSICSEV